MSSFTPEARAAAQLKIADKQLVSFSKLSKQIIIDPADVLAIEADLRLAHQEADRLRQHNHKLIAELSQYEQQRKNALSALETYRRQVHGNEQQMQHQIHELQQQLKETTTSLTLLQQQHSACAAAKTAGLEAARERDRLWQDLINTQARLEDLQQQLAHAQARASSNSAPQQAQQQDTTSAQEPTAAAGVKGGWLSRWRLGPHRCDPDTPHVRPADPAVAPAPGPAQAAAAGAYSSPCGAVTAPIAAATGPLPGSTENGLAAGQQTAVAAPAAPAAAAADPPFAGAGAAPGTGAGAAAAAAIDGTQDNWPTLCDDAADIAFTGMADAKQQQRQPPGTGAVTVPGTSRLARGSNAGASTTGASLRGPGCRTSSGKLTADVVGRAAAGRVQKKQHEGRGGSRGSSLLRAPVEWLSGLVHKLGSGGTGLNS